MGDGGLGIFLPGGGGIVVVIRLVVIVVVVVLLSACQIAVGVVGRGGAVRHLCVVVLLQLGGGGAVLLDVGAVTIVQKRSLLTQEDGGVQSLIGRTSRGRSGRMIRIVMLAAPTTTAAGGRKTQPAQEGGPLVGPDRPVHPLVAAGLTGEDAVGRGGEGPISIIVIIVWPRH